MKEYPDEHPVSRPKNNVPRARMFLRAQLGWLWGYPLAAEPGRIDWQTLYYPQPWDTPVDLITPAQMGQLAYAHVRMVNAFPKALPEVVGDVEAWSAQVSRKLQALRSLLEGKPVDPWEALYGQGNPRLWRQVQSLQKQQPGLRRLLDTFAWWLALEPKTLEQAVGWIEAEQQPLLTLLSLYTDADALRYCASLFALSQRLGEQRISRLLAVWVHLVWQPDGAADCRHWFERCETYFDMTRPIEVRGESVPEPPGAACLGEWGQWLDDLMQANPKGQRRLVDAVLLLFEGGLPEWGAWGERAYRFIQRYGVCMQEYRVWAERDPADPEVLQLLRAELDHKSTLYAEWQQLGATAPPLFNYYNGSLLWTNLMQAYAHPERLAWLETLAAVRQRLLGSGVEATQSVLAAADALCLFAVHWAMCEREYRFQMEDVLSRLNTLLGYWFAYVREAPDTTKLLARVVDWNALYAYRRHGDVYDPVYALDARLLMDWQPPAWQSLFFSRLAQVCDGSEGGADISGAFYQFYRYAPAHWDTVAYFRAARAAGLGLDWGERECQLVGQLLAPDYSAENFIAIVTQWNLAEQHSLVAGQWDALPVAAWLSVHGYLAILQHVLREQAWSAVATFRPVIEAFSTLRQAVPQPIPQTAALDMSAYPDALHPALALLQEYHPKAAEAAGRVLSKQFPDRAALQQQIGVLQQKLQQPLADSLRVTLQQRLASLQQRLVAPEPVSAERMQRLASKLYQVAIQAFFDQWQQQCFAQMAGHLAEVLFVPHGEQAWLADRQQRRTLIALAGLERPERKLAGVLLQAAGQGVFPLVDLPANHAWLQRMQVKGIQMQPWLAGTELGVWARQTEAEPVLLTFRFAQTVFEVWQMGDHFETCLSHDGCNFFSVVANAIDLNKRVVYAFDEAGRVQGRCLLAISDEGHLLHFHPYSHLEGKAFRQCVGEFVSHLERLMHISRSTEGKVSVLVARRWYDDGIETLYPAHPVFSRNSVFRRSLAGLAAGEAWDAFQQALQPNPVMEISLQQLLDLPEAKKRPDVLLAMALAAQAAGLLRQTLAQQFVRQLYASQVPVEQLWPLVAAWVWDYLDGILGGDDPWYVPAIEMDLLACMQPERALRLFWIRQRKIEASTRLQASVEYYRAKALHRLNRPHQALRACQTALDLHYYPESEVNALIGLVGQQLGRYRSLLVS